MNLLKPLSIFSATRQSLPSHSHHRDNAFRYCQDLVRKADYENYLCTLFIPPPFRNVVWALRAFNVEMATMKEAVKEESFGKMRFAFWRQAIKDIFQGKPPPLPVATALAYSLEQTTFSSLWLNRILSEREKNLTHSHFHTLDELETYAENTASCLLYLQLEALGIRNLSADHAASHLGKALGISTLLRATSHHLSQRSMVLPYDIAAKHSISEETLYREGPSKNFYDAVFDVATVAHQHIYTSKSFMDSLSPQARIIMLPAVPCSNFLTALEKLNFDVLSPELQKKNWKLPLEIYRHFRAGTY